MTIQVKPYKVSTTVQLSSKVMFAHVPARILDMFRMHSGRVPSLAKKGVAVTYLSLAAAILQGFVLTQMHLMRIVQVPDA